MLSQFIRDQATLFPEAPHTTTQEIARLTDLAATLGIPTTKGSISESYYARRRAKRAEDGQPPSAQSVRTAGKPRKRRTTTDTTEQATPEQPEASTRSTPPVIVEATPTPAATPDTPPPAPVDTLSRDFAAMQAMLEDGIAALTLIKDTLAGLQPAIAAVSAQSAETSQLREKLARLERAWQTVFNEKEAHD